MVRIILISFTILLTVPSFSQDRTSDLMPVPSNIKTTNERFRINKSFSIGVIGNLATGFIKKLPVHFGDSTTGWASFLSRG